MCDFHVIASNSIIFKNNDQLPACITNSRCECFNELLSYRNELQDENYLSTIQTHLGRYMKICDEHMNKGHVTGHAFTPTIKAWIYREMIQFTCTTLRWMKTESFLKFGVIMIDYPNKGLKLNEYIKCTENFLECLDLRIVTLASPDTNWILDELKSILKLHYEIVSVFEQLTNLITFNETFVSESVYGIKNNIHMYYLNKH